MQNVSKALLVWLALGAVFGALFVFDVGPPEVTGGGVVALCAFVAVGPKRVLNWARKG